MVQNSLIQKYLIIYFPTWLREGPSSGSEQMNGHSGARHRENELGVQTNGQASDPVTYVTIVGCSEP